MDLLVTLNATDLTADGWLKIAPWGDHPNSVGLQRVQKEDGDAMVAAFNSLQAKAARLFRGIPIYVGHPDRDPNRYPDKRRYGKITALESRADGLYAQPAFNDLGQQVIDQGHYLYNSPVWALKREGNVVRPIELLSIGLTNEPNIKGEPWAKNEAAANGDLPGHPFRGNQHADGAGAAGPGSESQSKAVEFKGGAETERLIEKGNHLARHGELLEKRAKDARNHPNYYAGGPPAAAHEQSLQKQAAAARHEARAWHEQALAHANANPDAGQRLTGPAFEQVIKERYNRAIMDGTMNTAPAPELAGGPSALLSSASNQPTTPNTDTPMTAEEKAQHEAALAALNAKIAELTTTAAALTAANTAAAVSLAATNTKAATERTARIELAANSIIAAGRRTTAQRPELVKELAAANDLAAAILAATNAKPALPTQSAVANLGARKGEGYQAAIIAINEAVRAHAVDNKIDIEASGGWERAWLGAKHKHPALFSATNAPAA